ncbi:MAG TPA: DNA polymerase III subunit delta [Mesotoga infera]|jgi:DNA polymerase-3 subunit delta|uniref:DNA polymerase III subunit delta n=1 Tax=Mesotoga infera TaxID=1236046 RepID=A0A117LUC1_9BACT|nr:MAG: DNA polymerase III, delta subunit [Mesotoga infera]KUK91000.1 MAG: DNA polymerase III, delta subunit [Mesotoga infera]HCO70217.1 DNA polymerase III subunit delta [Mesotoga infera]
MIYEITGDSDVLKDFFISERTSEYLCLTEDMPEKGARLKMALSTAGMFGAKPIRLSGFDKWKREERSLVETLIPAIDEDIDLYVEGKLSAKTQVQRVSFNLPRPWEDEKWHSHVMKIARLAKIKISREAAAALIERIGRKEYRILRELEKLSILSRDIDAKTVEEFVDIDPDIEVESLAYNFLNNDKDFLSSARRSMIPFTYFSSVLLKIVLDLGAIIEVRRGSAGVSWSEIKEISTYTGISNARVARLVGYSFSNTKDDREDLCLKFTSEELRLLVVILQELDDSIKKGQTTQELAFFNLVGEF